MPVFISFAETFGQFTDALPFQIHLLEMKFDAAFTSRLEKLARLSLNDEERELLAADLTKIVAMIDKLNSLDTKKVEPLIWMLENETAERPDKVQGQLPREKALQNAPDHDEQFFRVKKFIKQG